MKIIVMYINVLIMIVRMLKMIVLNVEDDSKSDSIENSVYWCDSVCIDVYWCVLV